MGNQIILLCILIPMLGAFLLPVLGKFNTRIRNVSALAFVATAFICAVFLLPGIFAGSPAVLHYQLPLGLSFGFLADPLAVFMALTASGVATVIILYSFGYMKHYDNQNEYYMMVCLFIGAMMGLVFSTYLIFMYMFWEISAICCWRLIG
ncbi:MAG: hypothetical protein KBA53_08040, partial [Thermoclostridium sp.]|nr:hypothetical protein [Thermoclostridium sp.]